MADTKGEGDPSKRPNTPPGALSREDLFNKSDEAHENNEEFVDVPDEAHDQLTEVSEETEQVQDKNDVVPEKKYKIKVNGQDREFTESEMIERASKTEGADQKFEEASRLRREAEAMKQLPAKDVAEPEVTDTDLAEARRLQMGSEEEAAKVISSLRNRPSLKEEDVVRKIDERLTFQSSVQRFQTKYPELFADPMLSRMVALKDEEQVKAGDRRPYDERYEQIGREMTEWLGNVKPKTDKQERKASITVLKTAQSRASEKTDDDEEQSTSDTIAGMAKARGQGYAK